MDYTGYNLLVFFFFITGFTCLAYGIFLISWKHHRSSSSLVLAIIILDLALIQFNNAIYHGFPDVDIRFFQLVMSRELLLILYFTIGPLLYAYVKVDVKGSLTSKEYLLCSIPLMYIVIWVVFFIESLDDLPLFQNWNDLPSTIFNTAYPAAGIYIVLTLRKSMKRSKLYWHLFILVLFILMVMCVLGYDIMKYLGYELNQYFQFLYACFVLLVIFVYGQIYIIIRYPDILTNSKYLRHRINAYPEDKYQETPMTEGYREKLLADLHAFLLNESNFTSSKITLNLISESIGYPSRDISQAINSTLGKSFKEYLNEIRIKYAVDLIKNDSDILIKEVMYASGFNSRSLFVKYFKEETGYSPNEYRSTMVQKA